MRKLLRFLFLLLFPLTSYSQPKGNEWIDYNQHYLKIPITAHGMYQLNYVLLNNAMQSIGVDFSTINPQSLQLFSRGIEQPIEVIGESDGKFDPNDYLIFYGEGNDGWLDNELYIDPTKSRINPYYSLYNDTQYYFLTWSSNLNNLRFKPSTNTNFSSKTAQLYFYSLSIASFNNEYNYGPKNTAGVSSPLYYPAEGYVSARVTATTKRTASHSTKNIYKSSGAPNSAFRVTYAGASNASGAPNHRLGLAINGNTVLDDPFNGYDFKDKILSLNTLNLNNTTQQIEYRTIPITPPPATDDIYIGYSLLEYPHGSSLLGESFTELWIPQSTDTLYYKLTDYTFGPVPFIYDLELGVKCSTRQSGNTIEFLIPPGKKRMCVLTSTTVFNTISTIEPVNSVTNSRGVFTDYSSILPDSAFIIISHSELWGAATDYSNYKTNNGMNALLVNVDALYEQFAYGIYQHSLAIKNFLTYLQLLKPASPPQYLFLAGKSVKPTLTRKNTLDRAKNKVPTIGIPPADNLYATSLKGNSTTPSIPVGRIAATSPTQLFDYLEKVKIFDLQQSTSSPTIADAIWKKRGIHFSGGTNDNEQNIFFNYLNGYKNLYESPALSGKIYTIKRETTGSIGSTNFDTVDQLINSGVSLLTFFGHGSNGQLGISLGEPSDYSNADKFPLFIANSCNVGDYHLANNNAVSVNEKWVLSKKRGVIGFIASTSLGYSSILNKYTHGIYSNLSSLNYGKPIGQIMKIAAAGMNPSDEYDLRTALEMNLHGDPSLILNSASKPDFAIEKEYVVAPEIISADNPSIEIKALVYNLGIASQELVTVTLNWLLPNGKTSTLTKVFNDISFVNEISFSIPIDESEMIGENTFSIHINPDLTVDETYPIQNNIINGIRVNVTSDDIIPIWPQNYAIVPSKDVRLVANTADIYAPEQSYVFELDINDQFNSSNKSTTTISSKGGVVSWSPKLTTTSDSMVYFWRCSPKKDTPSDFKWRKSSFQIIDTKQGWSQYDFAQFENNKFNSLIYNKPKKEFEFISGSVSITGSTKGYPTGLEYSNVKWALNGNTQGRVSFCGGIPSLLISVINPKTLEAWETRYFDNSVTPPIEINGNRNYGNYNDPAQSNCPTRDKKFMFRVNSPPEMDSLVNLLTKHIPDSHYILIMTGNRSLFRDTTIWKERHYKAFEEIGSDSIRTIANDHPLILLAQKGAPEKTIEVVGQNSTASISISQKISASVGSGIMESVVIGPTNNWKQLSWNTSSKSTIDSLKLTVYGLNEEGEETELFKINERQKNINNIQNAYPTVKNYNYLKLKATFSDLTDFTPPQLLKWQLYFNQPPEFAIVPTKYNRSDIDTFLQGEPIIISNSIINTSPIDAYKIGVKGYLRGQRNQLLQLPYTIFDSLNAWSSIIDSLTLNSTKLSGSYTLTLDLNPLDTNWHPEATHFNNLLQKSFYVKPDRLNPLLDVTFDGIHILDGDIVSARPEIRISLNDENPFLPLKDTANFQIFLTHPNKSTKQIYFVENNKEQLIFEPSSGKKNKASILYNPSLTTDGVYKLSVNATDVIGNSSGSNDFEISFEIINKSSVTHIMNYPNPFTTKTQFVFTLTGYRIPDIFRIQILNINGRVVREIDRNELGHIHIGRNITEYTWNGTDEFGDRLANGVYFYRVITKIEGESIEHRSTGADKYFKKEFGKMYLFR